MLVSDNAICFTSAEFADFTFKNGIKHVTSVPFHPSSNRLAERAVRTFKEGMKRMQGGNESLERKVSRFLFSYRITPHSTTGLSPAEMLMSRRPRSAFDLLLPDLKSNVEKKQWKQKVNTPSSEVFHLGLQLETMDLVLNGFLEKLKAVWVLCHVQFSSEMDSS